MFWTIEWETQEVGNEWQTFPLTLHSLFKQKHKVAETDAQDLLIFFPFTASTLAEEFVVFSDGEGGEESSLEL